MKALLALEDGRVFHGVAFGKKGTCVGEICFNTSMTGYQEVITDPSYRGQIVTMTYPLQGNYGITLEDGEAAQPHIRGFVIEELCQTPSNWRSKQTLESYFLENGILGIQGIDTRAVTKHLRSRGAMNACISSELTADEAVAQAQKAPAMAGLDLVAEVTTPETYHWSEESRQWTIPNVTTGQEGTYYPLPPVLHRVVAYDFGVKKNILRSLRQAGLEVTVVNAHTSAEDVLAMQPDGVFLSNGPGDPAALKGIHAEVRKLIGKVPLFGICLGHQILTHAVGGSTYKLKFGHRGANQPVKDLRSGKIAITAQNHGFATDTSTLPGNIEVTHVNLNDQTVEGFRLLDAPAFSVQHHPEAAPGPNDARDLFTEFASLITAFKS